jgi:predicted aspartyl protease
MNKAILLVFSLFIFLPPTLATDQRFSGEKHTSEAPTLEQILDRYVHALGGKPAIEKITTRASKGTFTSSQLKTKGPIELYAKAPNKQLMVLLAQGFGNYRRGFNGVVAWEKYPGGDNASNLSGFSKRDAEFYLPVRFRETYPNLALQGREKLREREVFVLEAPAAGRPKRWYFDTETGLLLRTETRNAQGKVAGSTDYDDYRGVDGVKEPFSIRLLDDDGTDFNIQLSEVRHNVQIADESFDKPSKQATAGASAKSAKAKPQVRFTSGNSATIPFEYTEDDNEVLQVSVNGSQPLNFTVDTGSDVFAIITARQAKSLGLTSGNNYKVGVAQNVGEIEAASIPSANLTLAGVEALNQRIEVLITDVQANNDGIEIDGVLGLEFLKHFVVEIDYEGKTIKLFSPDKYQYSGRGETIPIRIKDGSPEVRMKLITASGKSIESYFEIDTGMSGTLLFRTTTVNRYGLPADMRTIQAPTSIEASGEFNRRIGRAKSLQLGRFIMDNPLVSLAQNVEGEGGLVGEEILRRFKVIFDFSHRRMILEPNSHFKDPYEEDMSGISLTPEKNNGAKLFRIRQVVADTPAADAGLQADDLITAIDGQPPSNFTEGHIEHMFKQEGLEFALTVKRGEKVISVRLKLRRLI